jgi:hypothetical protein
MQTDCHPEISESNRIEDESQVLMLSKMTNREQRAGGNLI